MKFFLSKSIGWLGSLTGFAFWFLINFINPYSQSNDEEVLLKTTFAILLPAILSFISIVTKSKWAMFAAFFISIPIALYLFMTPGIYQWVITTTVYYLCSAILMILGKRKVA